MGLPPVDAGSIHESERPESSGSVVSPVGEDGAVRGVAEAGGSDHWLGPAPFIALTRSKYEAPFVRPVTVVEVVVDTPSPKVIQLAPALPLYSTT